MSTKTVAEHLEDFFEDIEVKDLQQGINRWLFQLRVLFDRTDFFTRDPESWS